MRIAKPIAALIEAFEKLPGIGPKTAQRLTFYLLHVPQRELNLFAQSLSRIKKDTVLCGTCRNVSETDPCPICSEASRDVSTIMVVEQPLDILAFEKTGKYRGLYHVLHGSISPLENIGPDEIYIDDLLRRVSSKKSRVKELIIATNPTMEGEATAMYLNKKLKMKNLKLTISRLGMGIPTGADLEYADETTLSQAIAGRREI
ncbi:recombination protein RecR [Candidatus Woesebacteria bacterium RBG_19FT_COMBO_47_8]|uniref:Recombination protein RecR n=1 Tax=Candidatus Woesebacteria bacterium RBG_13_46_13 TaxID=1802479 RepID=A0A1F7X6Q9_9BACT|nr:MAG: recombination protein RecR [Candidatus Woesebacteria bacterium RBG_13_46_13]OGM18126.1 MAG: recombination protein RecR [Candidatus Woesebacteria bacterium RBG_19FT_COMBO_47_8]HJX59478.1 recombination mediator RecR [Patescibacteria group bacterium]